MMELRYHHDMAGPTTAGGVAPYEDGGRSRQKQRTREALVRTARSLMTRQPSVTVEKVAAAAGVSRTTAYRYFPDQAALLRGVYPSIGELSLLGDRPPETVEARVLLVVDGQLRIVQEWEPQLRAALWTSLAPGAAQAPLRGGRAIGWFQEALAPLCPPWSAAQVRRLAVRLRAVAGIEPWVWLVDVAGESPGGAARIIRANALAVLRSAVQDD